MGRSASERRRAPRVAERLPLTIGTAEQAVAASSQNLSSSGVYCELATTIPLMTQVEIAITLPQRAVHCRGVVVRSDAVSGAAGAHYRVAVFFTRVSVRDRQAIAQFVAARLAASGVSDETPTRRAPRPPPPSRANAVWLAIAAAGLLGGCAARLAVMRGGESTTIVNELGTTAAEGQTYTFRWLQRQAADFYTHLRFDGLIVDLQGRQIAVVRHEDGNHVLELRANVAPASPATSASLAPRHAELTIQPQDLPTLQAVVRRYRFEPQLVTDAVGVPQVVVYAPVSTKVTVLYPPHQEAIRIEVRRMIGQPTRTMMPGAAASSGAGQ